MQMNDKLREALVSVKKSIDEMGADALRGRRRQVRYIMLNHANAHYRKRKGLPFHVNIYDTKNKEYLATAFNTDFAAKIVSALNECAEKEGEKDGAL